MGWTTFGLTHKEVGFVMDGNVCEGGHCEHLDNGGEVFGHSSEHDSFGSEMYLMCKPCYEKFVVEKREEPTTCHDCGGEFPRSQTVTYTPYDPGTPEYERIRMRICKGCQQEARHKDRLLRDQQEIDRDREEMESLDDEHWDREDDL
jgi:hypothetical protein